MDINTKKTADEKIKDISKVYIKIYNVFFMYLFFILAILIATTVFLFLIRNLDNNSSLTNIDNNENIQASKLNFERQQKTRINTKWYEVRIIWGEIDEEKIKIKATNSLISIWWIILPRLIYADKSVDIEPIKYFLDEKYDKSKLETFIKHFILNEEISFFISKKPSLAKIDGSISNTFFLDCLNYSKIYNKVCNHYLNQYIDNFFYYDISTDYIWFKKTLEQTDQNRDKICKNIHKYILYSRITSLNKNIFDRCEDNEKLKIQETKSFVQINNEMENKYISEDIYSNKELNAYKLLSIQQIIFKDFLESKIPTERISKYLKFLGKIVKSNLIDNFYLDESYWFNNYYLTEQIDKFEDYSDEEAKRKIYWLIQDINSINYWNKLENIVWLESIIKNKELIRKYQTTEESTNRNNSTWRIEILSTEIENSEYLIISKKSIEWNKLKISWYIKTERDKNRKELTSVNLELTYNWQNFVVSKIQLISTEKNNALINNFISKQEKSLPETYEYFQDIMGFHNTESSLAWKDINICESIKNKITSSQISVVSCSDKELLVKNNDIDYKFSYNKYIVTKIDSTNKTINQEINDTFGWIQTNEDNIIDTLINIITFHDKNNFKTAYIDAETVRQIESQIWAILEFAQSWNKLLFETNIKWIDFIINYDKEKRILWPMYFKNMLINTRPLIIKNTYISLDNIEETKLFKKNPIDYIKVKDRSSYIIYQQAN